MDRNELIKALGAAFSEKNDNNTGDRLEIESAMAGSKSVLRVTEIRDNSPMFELLRTHPEAYVVDNLVSALLAGGERVAEQSGNELREKFRKAVEAGDDAKIESMIQESRAIFARLQSAGSAQRALVYLYAQDEIGRM